LIQVHDPNIDNNASNVEIEEVQPFEMVFARMENRRMGLKNKKQKKYMYKNKMTTMKLTMMKLAMMKLAMMKSMSKKMM